VIHSIKVDFFIIFALQTVHGLEQRHTRRIRAMKSCYKSAIQYTPSIHAESIVGTRLRSLWNYVSSSPFEPFDS